MSLEMSVMDLLPDDVLVEVLQYVDVPDLLRCRLVCKRLQALVRDEEVWRHREVHLDDCLPDDTLRDDSLPDGCLRRPPASPFERVPLHLLSLAPCLGHLYICAAAGKLRALTTTKCAVARLTLHDHHTRFDVNARLYAQVVSHQEALGRLRSVHLICGYYYHNANASCAFLDTLLTCPRLGSLTCSDHEFIFTPCTCQSSALFASPVAPSLRKFRWHLNEETTPFVRAVLAGHSATLEDVDLRPWSYDHTGWTDDTIAALLGALPKLYSLHLTHPKFPGLEAVAACGALRKLSFDFLASDPDEAAAVADPARHVVELLRRASKQLRYVRLALPSSALNREVLKALASPGLERLEFKFFGIISEAQPLLRVLSSLPALRHLVLDDYQCWKSPLRTLTTRMVRDLLLGITPATAPALRILELKMDDSPCPHSWIHEDAVYRALIANPSLHIQLGFTGAQSCRESHCVECAMDCHKDIWKAGVGTNDVLKVSIHLHKLQIAIGSRVLSSCDLETVR